MRLISANFNRDDVLLFVTDGAPYMTKAISGIKILYFKMIHVTCIGHVLHRVAEFIREQFQDVDIWVANLKKIFLKAPSRVQIFKEMAPGLLLPPKPILARWGTWISAVKYSHENFKLLQTIVANLDEYMVSINLCKSLTSSTQLKNNIAYVSTNYGFLTDFVEKFCKIKMCC